MRALKIPSEAAETEQEFAAALDNILAEQFEGADKIGTTLAMPRQKYNGYYSQIVFDFAAKQMIQTNTGWGGNSATPVATVVTPFAELEKNGAGNLVRAAQKAFQEKLKL